MIIETHDEQAVRLLRTQAPEHIRLSFAAALAHARQRILRGEPWAEVWTSWHPTDDEGSRRVHVVLPSTRQSFDEVIAAMPGTQRVLVLTGYPE